MKLSSEVTDNHLKGIAWMLATMFWFIALDTVAKYLIQDYPVAQVVWGRFFFHFIFVIILMGSALPALVKSQSYLVQGLRSFFMFVTTVLVIR